MSCSSSELAWARAAVRALVVRIAMAIEQEALAGFALAQRLRAKGR